MPDPPTVLLVDDDRDLLRGTSLRLKAAGYRTILACDGEEGLDCATRHRPAAIVLDVRMPRKDGLTTLAELQARVTTKCIPVVMLSASLGDQRAALENGARFFLRKPYSGAMLINAVKKVIEEVWDAEETCLNEGDAVLPVLTSRASIARSIEMPSAD
jgi:DNA-binding response OmpR family regulator